MSLRTRLALIFALGSGLLVTVAGLAFVWQLSTSLSAALDSELRVRATVLVAQLASGSLPAHPSASSNQAGSHAGQSPAAEQVSQVLRPGRPPLYSSGLEGAAPLLSPAQLRRAAAGPLTFTAVIDAERLRVLASEARFRAHPAIAVVAAPTDVADTALALLNFDGISYAKGAAVLKQLVAWLGDKPFLAGLNEHFAAHGFANATLADLLGALSRASGRDLSGWAQAWLRTAQVNTLHAETVRDGAEYATVTVVQTAPERHPTLRPHRLGVGLYDRGADGTVTRRRRIDVDLDPAVDGGRTVVPELAGEKAADLLLLNDGDLTYAKIRLDDASVAAVPMILPLLDDSLARAVIWAATLDAVVDGERPVAELVAQVLAALPVETEVIIVEDVLKTTRGLVDRYATPSTRPAALEMIAQACDRLLAGSPTGGSRQLAAVRGLIGASVDVERLRGWLDGAGVPEGLAVDTDLRWLILYRLVVLGAAGPELIEAELARDRSATGEQWSARCSAALPSAEAKAKAWATLIGDTTVSNRIAESAAAGLWQPEQLALTEGYVDRYFAEMPEMMTVRSGFTAERIALTAYPALAVQSRTRKLAAGLLARSDLSTILRRVITDADDDMRRALDSRSALSAPL
jgi:aminopeptidase N